jgi:ubiquinone/menaquinone biosynthesis C-methylase UbiE
MANTRDHDQALAQEFDRWAHDGVDQAMERGHGRFTELALRGWALDASSRVLDVGCGNGWAVRRCIAMGAGDGVGVDIAAEMVALATPPGRYLQATADALPLPDTHVTHVLSVEALYYTADPDAALQEWARVARPGARLLLLLDLYQENPCHLIWEPLFPFPVQIRSEEDWVRSVNRSGWQGCTSRRIHDPRGPVPQAAFEPNPWAPSYADYLAEKRAGTLCLEAVKA